MQSFVKKIFETEEFFKLKEGRLSTGLEQRKNEFIHEKKAKEKRKADFVVYINPEIVIPVEVECYGNIKIGESQLFKYQKDFDKQYGILTDGYSWRFYNNNIFRTFTLNDIFDKTSLFLEFWSEYIKPEFYYLSFFETAGQLALLEKTKLHFEKNRQLFFEDITKRIESFKNKLQLEGYLENLDGKEREKRAIEITYAYIIQFILYKTLVDNEFGEFAEGFQTKIAKIHEYLKVKKYKNILGIIDGISANISKNIYRPFAKEQSFIRNRLLELYQSVEDKLSDVSPWLDIFVFIKKYNFANVKNEIFGYIYENYLKELYEESKKGQYFTDPAVVNFMLKQVGYTPENIKKRYEHDKDSVSLIDPSCGSGTFLYAATDAIVKTFPQNTAEASRKIEEVVTKNTFGLDIEEFPLYLAEMNILMRLLPLIISEKYNNPIDKKIKVFKTRDSVSEFMDTDIRNTLSDISIEFQKSNGQVSLFTEKLNLGYSSYVRDEDDLKEMKNSLENQPRCPRRRFDFVIGNPPYVPYITCAKQGLGVFQLMKEKDKSKKVFLSDIYGVNLHSTPLSQKKRTPKPNLYAFFVALGLALLKDNGRLCYIVPQTLLTAGDLDVLRYHLAKFTTIEKIIIPSGKMFIGRGLKQTKPVATSSLIFVVRRKPPRGLHEVEVIYYKDFKDDIEKCLSNISKGRKITKKKIMQEKFSQNTNNWNFVKQGKKFLNFYERYKENTENIAMYYQYTLAQEKFGSKFYFDTGFKINEKHLLQTSSSTDHYTCFKPNKKWWKLHDIRGYWPNDRNPRSKFYIGLLQPFKGYALLDTEFKILWRYANTDKFYFTSKPTIWARNHFCAIGSNNISEMLFLFSILNSPINELLLTSLLKSENEKDFLIPVRAVRDFVRVPRINEGNQPTKNKIIELAKKMLDLEELVLSDLVDFSGMLRQKFDNVYVEKDKLILEKGKETMKLNIKKNRSLVEKVIEENFEEKLLESKKRKIGLSELKSSPAIDFEKQKQIKDHIDDLVFCLYFKIQVPRNKLSKSEFVKKLCEKNKFYSQLG